MRENEVLAAVRALAPALRERAAATEELRRMPDDSVAELGDAGFFRLLQPAAHGGFGADPAVHHAAVQEIARACGSTGWAAAVLAVHPWHVALFDPRAQDDVWGAHRDALLCSSYAPTGTVTAVDGGFRLSGRWHFSSGCDHADWALLGGLVTDGEGSPVDMRTFLVPRSAYAVDAVWDTVGLRGTGSNDLVVKDVYVPAHRSLGYRPVNALDCPGHEINPEPLYRLPYAALFTTTISTAMVGIAEGAYEEHLAAARDRSRTGRGPQAVDDPFAQVRIARAASEIDAAQLQLTRNMRELYATVARGERPTPGQRARTRRDQALATERAVTAVDLLVEGAGGGIMGPGGGVVQRAWRDLRTGRGQAANDLERALGLYGRHALGVEVNDSMV
ncbi:3-hydroxy-9,10-secoandrosta-1,3,5(10)-triene-9,17-dione monooxygenase oxygenase subunit [Streptomyces cavernicola]|uniref:Acyl-CoA dehydrogenase family protein n=1 Tax=Streptomyces cavernicola TaxID=3043613 RepID=A0ABT6SMZ1_9ACTN|nr:3-hydroxy-9,10-secoandrosta-1,3,5(10)-triene-9,17-dione monooxygenase oxygenase subunit [Streptomyces sp. B-S-A6]MDI3408788.1 acyl-CoA dehydrogenase family protein [Streptomyces sp. B-S-A6]